MLTFFDCNSRLVELLEKATFTTGQRGCLRLTHKGFNYVKNRKSQYRTYWICARKDSTQCRARIVTCVDGKGVDRIVHQSTQHNHPLVMSRRRKRLPLPITFAP